MRYNQFKSRIINIMRYIYLHLPIAWRWKRYIKNNILHYLYWLIPTLEANDGSFQKCWLKHGCKSYYPIVPIDKIDWASLGGKADRPTSKIDVIIPVYDGYEQTLACIHSVLLSEQYTNYELIVINDCSPNPALTVRLRELALLGLFTLIENRRNLGFVATVNSGMSLHPNRDVILLNSDAEVYNDWLDRIYNIALGNNKIATVTPFSNNASICSYPFFVQDTNERLEIDYAQLDLLFKHINKAQYIEIPTGVGFCMFISRKALNQVGLFDAKSFGLGYGEENDFCLRARKQGWINVLGADTFVRHIGSSSFGDRKHALCTHAEKVLHKLYPDYHAEIQLMILQDNIKMLRRRIDLARIGHDKPSILFISHSLGGGTEKHIEDMVEQLAQEGVRSLIIRGNKKFLYLSSYEVINTPNLIFDQDEDFEDLIKALQSLNIKHIAVHHTINFSDSFLGLIMKLARSLALPYDFTVHDYYPICPRINLIGQSGYYCGEPAAKVCNQCIEPLQLGYSIEQWRENFYILLKAARKIFVPSQDVATRMNKYFDDLDFVVRPHLTKIAYDAVPVVLSVKKNTLLNVIIIGAICPNKGADLIYRCALDAKKRGLGMHFTIIGYTSCDSIMSALDNVTITGKYTEESAIELIQSANGHIAFFASVCPETFSYTLSLALAVHLFPVSFDLGALAVRIKEFGWGALLPIDLMDKPKAINDYLLALKVTPLQCIKSECVKYNNILHDYYEL